MRKTLKIFTFAGLMLSSIHGVAQTYDEQELSDLRAFLRQESTEAGKANVLQFTGVDTTNWETETAWLNKVQLWTSCFTEVDGVYRLKDLNWFSKKLAGKFSLPHCTYLEKANLASNTGITEVDVSQNTNLKQLTLTSTQITDIDVSLNTALTHLTLASTNITEADVSGNPNLTQLDVQKTQVTKVDVSKNPLLSFLLCSDCPLLEDFDFSENQSLKQLNCLNNPKLTSIDVSSLGNLEYLMLNGSRLTSLDLRANLKLKSLQCRDNNLERIVFPQSSELELIYCEGNKLREVEGLENLSGLETLVIRDNQLTSLDLSSNTALIQLDCQNNQLKEIKGLENLSNLKELYCQNNQLTSLKNLPTANMTRLHMPGNKLRFSTMPTWKKAEGGQMSAYEFHPQQTINGGAVQTGDIIDLSAEYSVSIGGSNEAVTEYAWFDITDGNENPVSLASTGNGLFEIDASLVGKTLRCKMTNGNFAVSMGTNPEGFPILYEIFVSGNETYAENEIEALKGFLRQPSANEGLLNAEVLGIDTASWKENNLWIYTVEGLTTGGSDTKQITSIQWAGKNLAGNLNLQGFSLLDSIDIQDNVLTGLNLDGCTALKKVYCQDNALRFSTLPALDIENYAMAPQAIWNGGQTSYAEGIDLSREYSVSLNGETSHTTFKWSVVDQNGEHDTVLVEQGNGKFGIPTELCGKNLRCRMTNEAFWGEQADKQLTLVYDVFVRYYVEPGYKEEDIASLKAFLRQPSATFATDQNLNAAQLGIADTTAWENGTDWISSVEGLEWTVSNDTYQLIGLDWSDRNLAGDLQLSGMEYLESLNIYNNRLASLNLENASSLTEIRAYNNNTLSELNLKGCSALDQIYAQNCSLASLDISSCANISYVQAYNNKITSFDASNKENLASVYLYDNLLEEINLTGCTTLLNLDVKNNRLDELNVNTCTALAFLNCGGNALTFATLPKQAIASYSFSPQADLLGEPQPYTQKIDLGIQKTVAFPGEETVITEFAWFNVTTGEEKAIADSLMADDGNGRFSIDESLRGSDLRCKMTNAKFPGLTLVYNVILTETLEHYAPDELADLRAFFRQPSVDSGYIIGEVLGLHLSDTSDWDISGKWVARLTQEGVLSWTEIDGKERLTGLDVASKNLGGALLLPHCTELTGVMCFASKLTGLDVSNSTKLTSLWCYNNHIPELDVSRCTKLGTLYCDQNQIPHLALENHPELRYLRCQINPMTELDVTGCPALRDLDCQYCQLTELDVTKNPSLTDLFVSGNQLSELDLSNNPELVYFYASSNKLSYITDFSAYNKKIWHLIIDHNLMDSIHLTDLVIETVDISYNKFTYASIPFDFARKYYTFAPQDTVELGKHDLSQELDISHEYMLDSDGSHTFYEWQELSNGEFVETDKVITVDSTGVFVFAKEAKDTRFRCILTNNNVFRSALTLEFYVSVVDEVSNEAAQAELMEVAVYPNPASSYLNVASSSNIEHILVYNLQGSLVQEWRGYDTHVQLDVENLPSGFYFLEINNIQTIKLIKK